MTSQERREAIIDAAVKIFAEKGFRGTTTRELAAAIGVSEPILYQHFHTKRDLYAAIIQAKAQAGEERIKASLGPYFHGVDDHAFFTALAEMIVDWYTEDTAYVRILLYSALENHELHDLFRECQCNSFLDQVTDYIMRRVEEGAFRMLEPGAIAGAFVGMVAHYSQCRVISPRMVEAFSQKESISLFVGIFLEGIRNPENN
jgi:AcrR family transcriptional regulator